MPCPDFARSNCLALSCHRKSYTKIITKTARNCTIIHFYNITCNKTTHYSIFTLECPGSPLGAFLVIPDRAYFLGHVARGDLPSKPIEPPTPQGKMRKRRDGDCVRGQGARGRAGGWATGYDALNIIPRPAPLRSRRRSLAPLGEGWRRRREAHPFGGPERAGSLRARLATLAICSAFRRNWTHRVATGGIYDRSGTFTSTA